jgi:hypothetical protein
MWSSESEKSDITLDTFDRMHRINRIKIIFERETPCIKIL